MAAFSSIVRTPGRLSAANTADINYGDGDFVVMKKDPNGGVFVAIRVWRAGEHGDWLVEVFRRKTPFSSEKFWGLAREFRLATQADMATQEEVQLYPPAPIKPDTPVKPDPEPPFAEREEEREKTGFPWKKVGIVLLIGGVVVVASR